MLQAAQKHDDMNSQKHTRNSLSLISFTMTAIFGWSLASGFTALLFAISMVLIQAAALLHIPPLFLKVKEQDNGLLMALYGGAVVMALLLSVMASIATLSGSFESEAAAREEQKTLQAAIDGYMEAGYITKGLAVKEQLDQLPQLEVSPLAAAAIRIEDTTGIQGETLVTGFITSLAVMLDLFIVMLSGSLSASSQTVISHSQSQPEPQAQPEPHTFMQPEVVTVVDALNNGEIKRLSVREVRSLLRCSQAHAATIARTCRQLELTI